MSIARKLGTRRLQLIIILCAILAAGGSAVAGAFGAFEIAWVFLTGLVFGGVAMSLESRRRIADVRNRLGTGLSKFERSFPRGNADGTDFRERRVLIAIESDRRAALVRDAELAKSIQDLADEVKGLRDEVGRLSGESASESRGESIHPE